MRLDSFLLIFLMVSLSMSLELSKPDQIIEVFRHGARGPFIGFDKSWEKDQKGKLTLAGMKQHYELGKNLSSKYPHIFDADQDSDELYILANAHSRCLQSAFFQRAGLYSKSLTSFLNKTSESSGGSSFQDLLSNKADDLRLSEEVKWPRIEEVDDKKARIFQRASKPHCPNGRKREKENSNDAKAQEAWMIFKDTIESIRENIPRTIRMKNSFDLNIVGDAMLVNAFHNKSLFPFGVINQEVARNFTFAYSWFVFHNEYGQKTQRQLTAYPILDEILSQLEAFKRGDKNHKRAALYSGHDYNIYAILGAFGVISEDCIMANFMSSVANETLPYPNCYFPYFASNLIFEFYNKTEDEKAYVKLLYNDRVVPLCGGQEFCEYDEFVQFARDAAGNHTPESYEITCNMNTESINEEERVEVDQSYFLAKTAKVETKKRKSTIETLLGGVLLENNGPSQQVILKLNERIGSELTQNQKGIMNSPVLIIVLGWAVLSVVMCLIIQSKIRNVRRYFLRKDKKSVKKNVFTEMNIEIKIN